MSLWFNKTISPVKYKHSCNYSLTSDVSITNDEIKEGLKRGKTDAETNPFDVHRTKATEYEKELQKRYEKKISAATNFNISRSEKWGSLLSAELKNILMAKKAYEARLKNREFKLSDSKFGIVAYGIILFCVIAVEIPFNITVFGLLGDNIIITGLLVLSISVILTWSAHFIGGWLKSEGIKARSFFLILAIFVLIGIISWVRLKFFAGDPDGIIMDYFKTNLELDIIVAMFFIINSLLFIVSIISSSLAHDSDPLFVKAKKDYNKLYKKINNLFYARQQEMNNLSDVVSRLQSCFKELRHIYTNAYEKTGQPMPMCFKESINVDTERIAGFEKKLKKCEENFEEQEQNVKKALAPIEVN